MKDRNSMWVLGGLFSQSIFFSVLARNPPQI